MYNLQVLINGLGKGDFFWGGEGRRGMGDDTSSCLVQGMNCGLARGNLTAQSIENSSVNC